MYKNLRHIFITFFIVAAIYPQSGIFTFSDANLDNGVVTELVSGVTLTVTSTVNNIYFDDWSTYGVEGFDGNAIQCGANNSSMTLNFSQPVDISKISCANASDPFYTENWVFTPNSGTPISAEVNELMGSIVELNFIGITSIIISLNPTRNNTFAIDDVNFDAPTPVELNSFTASIVKDAVELKWQTVTEVNNFGFEIERSTVKGEWSKVGFVNGSGNSSVEQNYFFVDNEIISVKRIYRLKQVDLDGQYKYSKEIEVDMLTPTEFKLAQNYPNPFNPSTMIGYQLPMDSDVNLRIYDMLGREVAVLVNGQQSVGNYEVQFDGSKLASGTYLYKLSAGDFTAVKKLLLIK